MACIAHRTGAKMLANVVKRTQRRARLARTLLTATCLLPLWGIAQTKPRPPAECRVQTSVADQSAGSLSVRVRANCPVSREQLKAALRELAPSAFAADARPAELRVDLGRLVEHPWLSTALARAALASREWDKARGRPRQRNVNQFSGTLLRLGGALDGLVPGWALKAVSAEKVLVQSARAMPELGVAPGDKALVPYDAQLVLHYAAVAAPAGQAPTSPSVVPPARLEE